MLRKDISLTHSTHNYTHTAPKWLSRVIYNNNSHYLLCRSMKCVVQPYIRFFSNKCIFFILTKFEQWNIYARKTLFLCERREYKMRCNTMTDSNINSIPPWDHHRPTKTTIFCFYYVLFFTKKKLTKAVHLKCTWYSYCYASSSTITIMIIIFTNRRRRCWLIYIHEWDDDVKIHENEQDEKRSYSCSSEMLVSNNIILLLGQHV